MSVSVSATGGGEVSFDVRIPANIVLGEVHRDSGLEGASIKDVNEQVRGWLNDEDFADFAEQMGHPNLAKVAKHMVDVENIENFMEGYVGGDPSKATRRLDALFDGKPTTSVKLFYGSSKPGSGKGHATNISVVYNEDTSTWDISFHNTGFGLNESKTHKEGEVTMAPCAYTFKGLDGEKAKKVLEQIYQIQKAPSPDEYIKRCDSLYGGVECGIGIYGSPPIVKPENFPAKDSQSALFMRAQVAGNCTYASLNAMLRYMVLREYGATGEGIRSEKGKEASRAVRMLDFYCRMKSMEAAFAELAPKLGESADEDMQKVMFLERLLEANACYFQRNIQRHYGAKGLQGKIDKARAEGNGTEVANLEKKLQKIHAKFQEIQGKFDQCRMQISEAKARGNVAASENYRKLEINDPKNTEGIIAAMPDPGVKAATVKVADVGIDPDLQRFDTALKGIKGKIADGTPGATWQAVDMLVELCKEYKVFHGTRPKGEPNFLDYVGNSIRSLILDKNFKVDISAALQSEPNVNLTLLEKYRNIAEFFSLLKTKSVGGHEVISVDEQNVLLTLQAQTLQIYRKVARRRNGELQKAHPEIAELKFDPRELVIHVPVLKSTDHCYSKSSVERRNELLKFSESADPQGVSKFVIGSSDPKPPSSAFKIFKALLGEEKCAALKQSHDALLDKMKGTEGAIEKNFEALAANRRGILRLQNKGGIIAHLNEVRGNLEARKDEITGKCNELKESIANLKEEIKALKEERDNKKKRFKEHFERPEDREQVRKEISEFRTKIRDLDGEKDAKEYLLRQYQGEDGKEGKLFQIEEALAAIDEELAEVQKVPEDTKERNAQIGKLEEKNQKIEENLKTLTRLLALQYAAQEEFFRGDNSGAGANTSFNDDAMGGMQDCTIKRLRNYTARSSEASGRALDFVKKRISSCNGDGLFKGIKAKYEEVLSEVKTKHEEALSKYEEALSEYNRALSEVAPITDRAKPYAVTTSGKKGLIQTFISTNKLELGIEQGQLPDAAEDKASGAKFSDIMTSDEAILADDWGSELKLDASVLPTTGDSVEFDISIHLKNLRELPKAGNEYARVMASAIGYDPKSGNIFEGRFKSTARTRWLNKPTPYAVCGLGDIDRLVALNEAFQMLRSDKPSMAEDRLNTLTFGEEFSPNRGDQFAQLEPYFDEKAAPKEFRKCKTCNPENSGPAKMPGEGALKEIGNLNTASPGQESGRNAAIVTAESSDIVSNLRKCNIENTDNPMDRVMSVLAVIGNDPHSFLLQLKREGGENKGTGQMVMALLAAPKSREIIANAIKTPDDAQRLADFCLNFLNRTWLDSATMRPFDVGTGGEDTNPKHVLTYNADRLNALALSVNAVAEILAMFGDGDGIDDEIKSALRGKAQEALERVLDNLNEKVLFQNVRNNTPEAMAARKQIAQLKLYLANQQSRLVGGVENLSAKWCANVIASLAECRDKVSNSLVRFEGHYSGVELDRFCTAFASSFPECASKQGNAFAKQVGFAAMEVIKRSYQSPEPTVDSLEKNRERRTKVNYGASDDSVQWHGEGRCFTCNGKIVCSLIDGKCEIIGEITASGSFKIENLIELEHQKLRDEICEFLGIGEKDSIKAEVMPDKRVKIIPLTGLKKDQEFFLTPGDPPIFTRVSDDMQLMLSDEGDKYQLFKNHFCWAKREGDTIHYTFYERTGEQKVAYRGIKKDGNVTFYRGDSTDLESEVKFLDIKSIPGLRALAGSNATENLDVIMYKQGEEII
ncbi:MAG: hypothetical protein LBJ94_01230, partial [Puniceicoccales bacterium]|nr:hypothetical protein [Puniceicoccales bacterium]